MSVTVSDVPGSVNGLTPTTPSAPVALPQKVPSVTAALGPLEDTTVHRPVMRS